MIETKQGSKLSSILDHFSGSKLSSILDHFPVKVAPFRAAATSKYEPVKRETSNSDYLFAFRLSE
jgi:hypothetical protein